MKFSVHLIAVVCTALVAACAVDANGPSSGNTELNLDIVNPSGTSGELGFSIDRVDYRISCAGNPTGSYPIPAADTTGTNYAYDDSVDISGAFEVVDTRVPPVWQAVMDLPPGDCTITLSVYEDDEVVCVGSQTLAILEDATTKYDIVLVCSLSVDLPDGMADVDGTFEFITGNLCPKLYVLNAIEVDVCPNPQTGLITKELQYRAKDPDNTCGNNCDPQSCTGDNPPICSPYPSNINDPACNPAAGGDPNSAGCLAGDRAGLVCTIAAFPSATPGIPGGTFFSPADGVTPIGPVLPVNLNTASGVPGVILPGLGGPAGTNAANSPAYPPLPNTNGSLPPLVYVCDQSVPGPVVIEVTCSDGDAECDQSKQTTVVCGTCDFCIGEPVNCSASGECLTDGVCDNSCDPAISPPCDRCPGKDLPMADGTPCGVDGMCEAGACVELGWAPPTVIGGSGTYAIIAQIGYDPSGNATVVWAEGDGSYYDIWSNRYTPGGGWTAPVLIENFPVGISYRPKLAVDLAGNATVVWRHQGPSSRWDIWSNRYVAGIGWGTPVLVESNAGDAFEPEIAVDLSGNVTAVWYQHNGTDYDIWSNRYAPGGGWGTPVLIENTGGDSRNPRVAVDSNGNATVVWARSDWTGQDIYSNRYTPGIGWGTPVQIDAGVQSELDPRIAVDPNGDAIVIWRQSSSVADWGIWSNRYTSVTGWGTATLVATDPDAVRDPELVVDSNGNATAVWSQGVGDYDIWSSRYTPGGGWGAPVPIEGMTGRADKPQLAVDPDGNVTTTWNWFDQYDPAHDTDVWSNRYTPGSGWGTPVLVDGRTGDAGAAQPAVDPDGDAVAVWSYGNGAYADVWFSRFEYLASYCLDQPVDCSASGECLTDGVCNPFCSPADAGDGLCDRCSGMDDPLPLGTLCSESGGNVCSGAGFCVECVSSENTGVPASNPNCDSTSVDCLLPSICLSDGCQPRQTAPDGTACSSGICQAGACVAAPIDPCQDTPFSECEGYINVVCGNSITSDVSLLLYWLVADPEPIIANQSFDALLSGYAVFDQSFLDAAQGAIAGGVTKATVVDLLATVQTRGGGATGPDVPLTAFLPSPECLLDDTGPGVQQPCNPANDLPSVPGVRGNADCVPTGSFNTCGPIVELPISYDCAPGGLCDILGKASQCTANGFCISNDLFLNLEGVVETFTAGDGVTPGQTEALFGWYDTPADATQFIGTPPLDLDGTYNVQQPVYTGVSGPVGFAVNAGGLAIQMDCVQGFVDQNPVPPLPQDASPSPDAFLHSFPIHVP